jgi:hypothetical protein
VVVIGFQDGDDPFTNVRVIVNDQDIWLFTHDACLSRYAPDNLIINQSC